MKNHLITLLATLIVSFPFHAGADPGKNVAGPNGGRVLTHIDPKAEFFVRADRKVQITFLDSENKAIAPAEQVVTVTAGERSAPSKLSFTKTGETLVSDQPLPEGNRFPAVVQIKTTPDAKTIVEKFNINFAICPGCSLAEYACICEHGH